MVAYAVRAPAGPERTDDVLGPRSGWLVALGTGLRCRQLKPACARPSSAVLSRLPRSYSRTLLPRDPRSSWVPSLTTPYRTYPTHPQSRPEPARLQPQLPTFWPFCRHHPTETSRSPPIDRSMPKKPTPKKRANLELHQRAMFFPFAVTLAQL